MSKYEYKEGTFTKATTYEEAAKQYSGLEWAAQLSEEAAELSKAALKLRRVCNPESIPTPVTIDDAVADLIEEMSDVIMCFAEVSRHITLTDEQILRAEKEIINEKKDRFLTRHNEHVDRYNAHILLQQQDLHKSQYENGNEEDNHECNSGC